MKITLELNDNVIAAFLSGVRHTETGLELFSHQIGSDDLRDGNTIKLPREDGGDQK